MLGNALERFLSEGVHNNRFRRPVEYSRKVGKRLLDGMRANAVISCRIGHQMSGFKKLDLRPSSCRPFEPRGQLHKAVS